MKGTLSAAVFGACTLALAAPPWQDPEVNAVNRLPARSIVVPCPDRATALEIAALEAPRTASPYILSLNGVWNFEWTSGKEGDAPKTSRISVPGCWQLQGDFDPPLYTNHIYPFEINPPVARGPAPSHPDWTINRYPDPVGVYERSFTIPAKWEGRRVVAHFGGVSSAMTLYVNGREAGYSEDARLPAEFDITPLLAKDGGANTIRVAVRKFCDGSYLEDQDFWRLSGIFRDVWLVAERPEGLRDFTIEADCSTGTATVRNEKGEIVHTETIKDFELWSSVNPKLYTVAFNVAGDWYARAVGFRTVAIEDNVLKVNGRRIFVKGVNRHEISPNGGYAMTHAEMEKDIETMKEFGFNAVRTCHYPDDPHWYDLCDKHGIYVTCEANIESHGMGYGKTNTFAKLLEWQTAHLERGGRMVEVFRDHPSIIVWSMGNESDMGPAFDKLYSYMKALDPQKRPVQYEQAKKRAFTDIFCPMYDPAETIRKYVADPAHDKPAILCEYSHAMGNSNGSFSDYWDNVEKYPSAQGGYIWDFADQALWQTLPDGTRRLAYGGDFGDQPNTGNFCCNGIFDALRRPHPGAWEAKAVFARFPDEPLEFKPNFYRAPTDNDRGWRMPAKCAIWKKATDEGVLPEGCKSFLEVETLDDGRKLVKWNVFIPAELPPPPRVGLTFRLPGTRKSVVSWSGRGPHENYADRIAAAPMGEYSLSVDELNPGNYILPCEQGYRTGTTRLAIDNFTIETRGEPFGFNVWPWTQRDLEKAMHVEELEDRKFLTVNIDAFQMGVGGDNSWGRTPHKEFMASNGHAWTLEFTLDTRLH